MSLLRLRKLERRQQLPRIPLYYLPLLWRNLSGVIRRRYDRPMLENEIERNRHASRVRPHLAEAYPAILVVFPFLGPIVVALVFLVRCMLFGIVTLSLATFVTGPLYFFWWLPILYSLLAAPFLLTGALYALAVFLFAPQSLVSALIAAIVRVLGVSRRPILGHGHPRKRDSGVSAPVSGTIPGG
jgi:hypothetical protein